MGYFKNGQANPLWLKKLEAVREILTSEGRTLAQGALPGSGQEASRRYRFPVSKASRRSKKTAPLCTTGRSLRNRCTRLMACWGVNREIRRLREKHGKHVERLETVRCQGYGFSAVSRSRDEKFATDL